MRRRAPAFEARLFLQIAAALCILLGFFFLVEAMGKQTFLTWLMGAVAVGAIATILWRGDRRFDGIVLASLVLLVAGYLLLSAPGAPLGSLRKRLEYQWKYADARGTPDQIRRRWRALTSRHRSLPELRSTHLEIRFTADVHMLERAIDQKQLGMERFHRRQIDRHFEELRAAMKRHRRR